MIGLPRRFELAVFWILRLGLGGMFALSGALKVRDPSAFAIEINNYRLLPSLAPTLAATLPAIEIALALALLFGPRAWVRAGALASALLMAVFTVAVGSVVARGIDIACGCFGEGSGSIDALTILRDVALLAASGLLYALADDRTPKAPPEASPSPA